MGICFSWSLLSIFLPCKPETTYKGTSYPQGWLVPLSTTGLEVALTQKRPGISLSDRFFLFQGENACRPTQNSWQIHLARAIQHIPVTGKKGQPASFLLSIYGFHRTAPAVWEKDKRDNLRRSSRQSTAFTDRASGLGKRQKGQLALSLLSMG